MSHIPSQDIFVQNFGLEAGTKLFQDFSASNLMDLRLPGIKHGISLRKETTDLPTFYQVFLENQYDIPYMENPEIIVDGGANIGLFSIYIKNKYPEAKVFCMEPDSENFAMLLHNLAPYDTIFMEEGGFWNKDTKLSISDPYNIGKCAMVVEEAAQQGTINAVSMSSFMKKYSLDKIDILKLDIEKAEKYLFSDNYEEWLPKVKMIVIEMHDWMEPGCAQPFFQAINKSFGRYKYLLKGENTVIINLDLL